MSDTKKERPTKNEAGETLIWQRDGTAVVLPAPAPKAEKPKAPESK